MKKIYFDIGANNGESSLFLANDPSNIVYAFEPTPFLIKRIENKILNKTNYFLIKKAVSNFNGKATFNIAGNADWGCSSLLNFSEKSKTCWVNRPDFTVTEKIEVDVIRLDSFIEEYHIPYITYLHIDTQGSDLNVLKGLGKYITRVEAGILEAANENDILYKQQNTKQECIEFLLLNNFEILNITSNDVHNNEVNISFKRK
jgi:FkbM family methyltransferase